MDLTVLSFLDTVKSYAISFGIAAFILVNGVAVVALLSSRSRALVQQWTSPWLAANLLLFGVGAGVPVLTGICKSVVQLVAPVAGTSVLGAQPPTTSIE